MDFGPFFGQSRITGYNLPDMTKVRTYFFLGILFAAPSGYGLYRLITETTPLLLERWLLFLLVFLLVCGLTMPVSAMLNRWFFAAKKLNPKAVVRESIGVAMLADLLIWLRIGRVLNTFLFFLLVGGFFTVEFFLRAQEKIEFREHIDGE